MENVVEGVADAVVKVGLGVFSAAEEMVSVTIDFLSTAAVGLGVEDGKAEFALDCKDEF